MILERRRQRHAAKTAAKNGSSPRSQDHTNDGSAKTQGSNEDDNKIISHNGSLTDDHVGLGAAEKEVDDNDDNKYFQNVLASALGKDSSKQFEYLFQSPTGRQNSLRHQNYEEEEEINLLDEILSSTSSSTPLVEDESQSTTSSVQRSSSHTMSSSHTASAASLLRRTLLETMPTSTKSFSTKNNSSQSNESYLEGTPGNLALDPAGDASSSGRTGGSNKDEDELKLRLHEITREHERTSALHELRRKRKLDKLPTARTDTMPLQQMSSPTSTATTSSSNTATGTTDQRHNIQATPTEGSFFSPADTRSQKVSKTSATPLWASFVPKSSSSPQPEQHQVSRQNLSSQNELGNPQPKHNEGTQAWKSPLPKPIASRGSDQTSSFLTPGEPHHADQQDQTQSHAGSPQGGLLPTVTSFSEQQQLKDQERLKALLDYETDRRLDTEARLLALEMELKELRVVGGPQIAGKNPSSLAESTVEDKEASNALDSASQTVNETSPVVETVLRLSSRHSNMGNQISPRRAMLQQVTQAFDRTEEDLLNSKNSKHLSCANSQDLISTTIAEKAKWWRASPDAENRYLEEQKKCQDLASELEALELRYAAERQEWQAQVQKFQTQANSGAELAGESHQEGSTISFLRRKLDEANAKIGDIESERDDLATQLEQSKSQHSDEKLQWQEQLDLAMSEKDNSQSQHAQDKAEWQSQREISLQIESERDNLRVRLADVETQLEQATDHWKERLQQVESEHEAQLEALEALQSHDDHRLDQYRERLKEAESDRDNARTELEDLLKSTSPEHGAEAINTSARVSEHGDEEWHDATDQFPSESSGNFEMRFTTELSQLGTPSANANQKELDGMMQLKLLAEEKCEELTTKLKFVEDAHTRERDDMHAKLNSAVEQIQATQAEQGGYATTRDETSVALEAMTAQYNEAQEKCNILTAELQALQASHADENEKWQSLLDTSLGEQPVINRSTLEGESVTSNVFVLQGRIEWLERQLDEVTTKHAKEQRDWHEQLQELMESPSKHQMDSAEPCIDNEDGEAAVPTTEWKLQVERKRLELLERHCQSLEAKHSKQEREWEEQMEIQLKRYKREESKCRQLWEEINMLQEAQRNGRESTPDAGMGSLNTKNDQENNIGLSGSKDDPNAELPASVPQTTAEVLGLGLSVLGFDDTLDCSAIRAPLGSFDTGCNSVASRSDDLDLSLDAVITEMEEDCKDFNVLLEQVGSDDIPVPSTERIEKHVTQATKPQPSIPHVDQFGDGESTSVTPQGNTEVDLRDASEKESESAFIDSAVSLVHNLTDIVNHSENEDDCVRESQVFDQLEKLSMTLSEDEEEAAKNTPSGDSESRLTISIQAAGVESLEATYEDEEEGRATPPHANLSTLTHEFDPPEIDGTNPWASLVEELQHKCEILQADRLELARTVNGMLDMERETHRLAVTAAVATAQREASEKLVAFQKETQVHVKQVYSIICEECRNQIFPMA